MPLHSPTTTLTSAHHRSPPPFFRHFGGSLSPPTSCLHPSIMALSAHPSGTFIALPASPLAHHCTRLHPSVTFVTPYLFHSCPILPSWHSRPIPMVRSSPSWPLRSLTTALVFTHL